MRNSAVFTNGSVLLRRLTIVRVIYICNYDIFKCDAAFYPGQRVLRTDGRILNNDFQEIYVNAEAELLPIKKLSCQETAGQLFCERSLFQDIDDRL